MEMYKDMDKLVSVSIVVILNGGMGGWVHGWMDGRMDELVGGGDGWIIDGWLSR